MPSAKRPAKRDTHDVFVVAAYFGPGSEPRHLLAAGVPAETIASALGMTVEEVKGLA